MTAQVDPVRIDDVERRNPLKPVFDELRGIAREPRGAIALVLLFAVFFFSFVLPILDPTDPNWSERGSKLLSISWDHPLGTDHLSRDLLARVSVSSRRTILTGFSAVLIGMSMGITIGYIAGWTGRVTDTLIMRALDVLMAFPGLVLAIVVTTILGTGLFSLAVAITIFNIPVTARLARAGVLRERERDYALAARTLGASGPTRALPSRRGQHLRRIRRSDADLIRGICFGDGGAQLPWRRNPVAERDVGHDAGRGSAIHADSPALRHRDDSGIGCPDGRTQLPLRRPLRATRPCPTTACVARV